MDYSHSRGRIRAFIYDEKGREVESFGTDVPDLVSVITDIAQGRADFLERLNGGKYLVTVSRPSPSKRQYT
jgi:hypothetical protein